MQTNDGRTSFALLSTALILCLFDLIDFMDPRVNQVNLTEIIGKKTYIHCFVLIFLRV